LKNATAPAVFGVMTQALNIATRFIPLLAPVVNAVAGAVSKAVTEFGNFLQGPEVQGFLKFVASEIKPMIAGLGQVAINIAKGLISFTEAVAPLSHVVGQQIQDLAKWYSTLANTPQFRDFVKNLAQDLPGVTGLIEDILKIFFDVSKAVEPATKPMIAFFDVLAKSMDKLATGGSLGALAGAVGNLLTALSPLLPPLYDLINAIATPTFALLGQVFRAFAPFIQQLADQLAPIMPGLAQGWSDFLGALVPLLPPLVKLAEDLLPIIIPFLEQLTPLLESMASITSFLAPRLGAVTDSIAQMAEWIGRLVHWLDAVKLPTNAQWIQWAKNVGHEFASAGRLTLQWLDMMWHGINRFSANALGVVERFLTQTIPGWTRSIGGFFASIGGYISRFFLDTVPRMAAIGGTIIHSLWNGMTGFFTKTIWPWLRSLPGWFLDKLKDADTWLIGVGEDIVKGLVKGITNPKNWIDAGLALLGPLGGLIKKAHDKIEGRSPSEVFARIGEMIPQGLALGITRQSHLPQSALDNTMNFKTALPVGRGYGAGGMPITIHDNRHINLHGVGGDLGTAGKTIETILNEHDQKLAQILQPLIGVA
jgi:hypothetical protein